MNRDRINEISIEIESLNESFNEKINRLVIEASEIYDIKLGDKIRFYKNSRSDKVSTGIVTFVLADGSVFWVQKDGLKNIKADRIIRMRYDIGTFTKEII